jgi:lon-related putative ATP-dependent protease
MRVQVSVNEERLPVMAERQVSTPIAVDRLYRAADLSALVFDTTADIAPIDGLIGQERALDAIRLSAAIDRPGFNLFAIGRIEAGMREAVHAVLGDIAPSRRTPEDWVYVNNFADARRPVAIALPAGQAVGFGTAMRELIDDLKAALPSVFASEEYQTQRGAIDETFQREQGEAFSALKGKASEKGIILLRTPLGFTLVPSRNGEVVPPEEFNAWPEAKRQAAQTAIEELEKEVERIARQIPQREKARREAVRQLNRQTAEIAVGHLIEERKALFADNAAIVAHLDRVRADLIDNVAMFVTGEGEAEAAGADMMPGGPFDRYEANILVSRTADSGAPVVEELHPTLGNLSGSIEHLSRQGALVTNFRLIKAGAIHRANGGYLLIDARNLFSEPFSWAALKRALRRREITIEDVTRLVGLTSTVSLEPDPIPLDLKIILFGDRLLYYLLVELDPEFGEHFKVLADFDDDIDRSPESEEIMARLIAAIIRKDKMKAMDRGGLTLTIEYAARLADNSGKLTALVDHIRDLLAEADFRAAESGHPIIARADVQRAIDERIRRAARLRDRMREMILDRVALIETEGMRVGQINGLSVIEIGGFAFGRPTRISCQVRPGTGRLIDIEREVELGGPIHSKGVMILAGFIAGRYALDTPMSLQASLVFEQSYSGVEGDSASSAELYLLLSALAGLPLRQDLAVTGSVNQHGEIQAIGGVNEKIEGFFDICKARGLTGSQGVVIPAANLRHLMLRKDVVEACAAKRFAVHAVSTIEEGLALMTGREAGMRDADGQFPAGTVNRLVEDRLRAFAEVRRSFAGDGEGSGGAKKP